MLMILFDIIVLLTSCISIVFWKMVLDALFESVRELGKGLYAANCPLCRWKMISEDKMAAEIALFYHLIYGHILSRHG